MTNETEKAELLPLITIWTMLTSVLCDANGNACIHGSGADLNIIDEALRNLFDHANTRTPDLSKLKSDEAVERVARAIEPETHGWDCFTQEALRKVLRKQAKAALAEAERILNDD